MQKRDLEDDRSINEFKLLLKKQKINWDQGLALLEFIRTEMQETCPTNNAIPRDVWWLIARDLLKENYKGAAILPQVCKEWKNLYDSFEMTRFAAFGLTTTGGFVLAFVLALDCCKNFYFRTVEFDFCVHVHTLLDEDFVRVILEFSSNNTMCLRVEEDPFLFKHGQAKREVFSALKCGEHTIADALGYSKVLVRRLIDCADFSHFAFPWNNSSDLPLDHPIRVLSGVPDDELSTNGRDIAILLSDVSTKEKLFGLLKGYNKIRKFW